MKKSILFFVSFMVFSMMAYSQGWNAATTGILYADPTSLKVGIGTSSPLSSTGMLLDIGGSTQVNGNIYPKLAITATDNSIQGMQLQNKSTGTSAEMRFIAAADDNSYMAFAQPSSTNTATTLFGVPKNSGSFIFNYANGGTARNLYLGTYNSTSLNFGTNSLLRMTILSDGYVGIGTTSPGEMLEIAGNLKLPATGVIKVGNWTNLSSSFNMALGFLVNDALISGMDFKNSNSAGQVRLMARNNQDDYLVMNTYGSGASGSIFGLNRSDAHAIFGQAATDTDKKLAIGTFNAGDLILGTYDTERMRILSTGNVGIGTTSPSEMS